MIQTNNLLHAFTEWIDGEQRTYQISSQTMLDIMISTAEEAGHLYCAISYEEETS